ncbi:MAG: D-aminoacyl-tRNA deacylase [Synergistaceae bacterium]|nr:D-aminoacyl-tRNA deacylase [Synergistaceae bacterium]
MRAIVQKVRDARATFQGEVLGEIKSGLCVLMGIKTGDTEKESEWMAEKLVNLRVFEDEAEKLNLSLLDVKGEMLLISQFTVYGDCRKGRRPSFTEAAPPENAKKLYEMTIEKIKNYGVPVKTGMFQTHMVIELANDGPVTLIIETPEDKDV